MRTCDSCQIIIPVGTNDYIDVRFYGKFGKLLKKVHGDCALIFCSLNCFNKFQSKEKD